MINLGINEFIRNIKKNIFIIIQMIIVYMIAIVLVSAFREQMVLYNGISNFVDSTGITISPMQVKEGADWPTDENLNRDLVKIEKIERSLVTNLYVNNFTNIHFIAYDNELVEYQTPLIKGEWCEDAKHKDGYVNIVVSENFPMDVNVGDDVVIEGYNFHITGVFSCDEMVYGINGFNGSLYDSLSYISYYSSVRDADLGYVAIASYDDMKKELGDIVADSLVVTIDYEDDITDEEMERNRNVLKDKYGLMKGLSMHECGDIYNYSKKLLEVKLLPILGVFVLVFLSIAISLLNSSAINVMDEKRNYGIYFISGNNWKNTIMLSLVHWSCVALCSLIVAVSACLVIKSSGKFDFLSLSFSGYHIIAIATITVLMLLMALILPYRMLKKLQPVSILKNNDK